MDALVNASLQNLEEEQAALPTGTTHYKIGFVDFMLRGNAYLINYRSFPIFSLFGLDPIDESQLNRPEVPAAYKFVVYFTLMHHFITTFLVVSSSNLGS